MNAVSNSNESALILAADYGTHKISKKLYRGGIENRSFISFPGQQKVVELLIQMGADVNTASNRGTTALIATAESGSNNICMLLKFRC